jgi:nicotinamidase-related amidase
MREGLYKQPALLVIDVQKGLAEPSLGQRNNPQAESNMASLLAAWRERGMPVIHLRHCSTEEHSPLRPELPGNAFKDEVKPHGDESVFSKTVNSAFIGTGLESHLRSAAIDKLVIIGLTTDHCVSASTRMASDLGFEVTLISDATAAFERIGYDGNHYSGEQIHRVNLVSLDGEFCRVRSTEEILDSIARSSHPNNDGGSTM